MVADKFLSDEFMTNADYALVGGLSLEELNLLEHEFLELIDFNLCIEEEHYKNYCKKLLAFEAKIKASETTKK